MATEIPRRRRTRLRWSSKTTWIGSLAVALAVGVAIMTSVASEQMIRDMEGDLHARASSYAGVLSSQLGPAVARRDRDAARRVLQALAADVDVRAVMLRTNDGVELYRAGAPGAWQPEDITAEQVVESDGRVTAAVPVVVPAGRSGLLTIELSTEDLHVHRIHAMWAAIAAGTAALVFALITRWVIARSVVRRLHAIIENESSSEPDDAGARAQPHDEIGVLGDTFHQILDRLRCDQMRLRATVSELTAVKDELAHTNHELEAGVERRTAELRDANVQLQCEMTQRSQIEVELRQAQKLESVGRLASGIAHEINTPVQFVSDSCSFLETATEDLIAVIAAYRSALAEIDRGATGAAAVAVARDVEAEREVGYLIEQIPLAITRALGGLERVSAIVRAMKEFAYPDHKEQVPADLNRAILSTLTVARNEYKYVAEVKTELADLPFVTCHIGELNQVILNMVVNSAHAIESAKAEGERDGLIVIRTRPRGIQVEIEIEDNGCGIPETAIDKIFDPFFTTKEIGKGTGQGLAIARAVVVDKHAGKIDVSSQVGRGTTFSITLPVLGRDCLELAAVPEPESERESA